MNDKSVFSIAPMRSAEDLSATTALFTAYVESLDINLTFQNFQSEIASMPGKYAYSKGELMLARNGEGISVGCLALYPLILLDAVKRKDSISPQKTRTRPWQSAG